MINHDDSLIMKRLVIIIFIALAPAYAFSQNESVKLASDIWPPFTDQKQQTSIAIDLVNMALNRTGVKVENNIIGFSEVLESIRAGEYDGSAALWLSDDREEYLLFSDPYLHNQLILVGRKGSKVDQMSISELEGHKVGIVGSYAYGNSIQEADVVEWVSGNSDLENLQSLTNAKLDYILVDALLIEYLLEYQRDTALQYLAIGKQTLIKKSLHFALRKDLEGAEAMIKRFNQEIIRMIADGSYNKVLHLNWIQADVDGDGTMELVLKGDRAGNLPPQSAYTIDSEQGTTLMGAKPKYYIGGSYYHSWDQVPKKYKQPQIRDEDLSRVGIASFRF